MTDDRPQDTHIREFVRERYTAAALGARMGASRCGDEAGDRCGGGALDDAEAFAAPHEAVSASLGDPGVGAGADVLINARRVGLPGRVIGLDMTDEMLDLARETARRAGAGNVDFVKGQIEQIPLQDAAVDVVISNCVINLSGATKPSDACCSTTVLETCCEPAAKAECCGGEATPKTCGCSTA